MYEHERKSGTNGKSQGSQNINRKTICHLQWNVVMTQDEQVYPETVLRGKSVCVCMENLFLFTDSIRLGFDQTGLPFYYLDPSTVFELYDVRMTLTDSRS
jgi:hypothetical protein